MYVDGENVDLEQFRSLGVIKDKQVPDRTAVIALITSLDEVFGSVHCNKAEIVNMISAYLPNFEHIETGKSLDGKM